MPGISPDELRGTATGWLRLGRREIDRRRTAARHAHQVAAHHRAIRRAQRWAGRYAGGAAVALLAVPLTHGWPEAGWGATGGVLATRAALYAAQARRQRRTPPPPAPPLPPALPPPPPMGSAAWPALRRVDAAHAALRRLAASTTGHDRELLQPALDAARTLDDSVRLHAGRVAAEEAAHRLAGRAAADGRALPALAELDRAAAALEDLVAAAASLDVRYGSAAAGPGTLAEHLRDATHDVLAHSYGLRTAASIRTRRG